MRKTYFPNIRAILRKFREKDIFTLAAALFSGNASLIQAANQERISVGDSYIVIFSGYMVVEAVFLALTYMFLPRRNLSFKSVSVGGFLP